MCVYIYICMYIYIYIYVYTYEYEERAVHKIPLAAHAVLPRRAEGSAQPRMRKNVLDESIIFWKQKACSCAPSSTGAAYAASGARRA